MPQMIYHVWQLLVTSVYTNLAQNMGVFCVCPVGKAVTGSLIHISFRRRRLGTDRLTL